MIEGSLRWLLLGYVLGILPGVTASRVVLAAVAKRLGVKPGDIRRYSDAVEGSDSE